MIAPASPQQRNSRLVEAATRVRGLAGPSARPLVIVTGSGLAGLASLLSIEHRIPLNAVPHMPKPTVAGHPGNLLVGKIGRMKTLMFAGRLHFYEGLTPSDVVFPIELAKKLGGEILLVTNASGGVNTLLAPGDLMMLRDHLDLTFRSPLVGPGIARGGEPPPRTLGRNPYDADLCEMLREAARKEKIDLKEGTYVATFGPSYETRAEAAMLREMDADAVGMSTVPEVLAARRVGFRVVAVSCIANRVPAWGRESKVTHAEVVERMADAGERLKRLVHRWVGMVGDDASSRSDR